MFGDFIYGVDLFGQANIHGVGPRYLFSLSGFHEVYPFDCVIALNYANTILLLNQ